jgi:hypothetical protein
MSKVKVPSIRDGFKVLPADNGGWVVVRDDPYREGRLTNPEAALTDDKALVSYLKTELGV